jgi:hypothetical protein
MSFRNARSVPELARSDEMQEIGVLVCFDHRYTNEIFSEYEYSFEGSTEKFSLKLEEEGLYLNKGKYDRLKQIHKFILAAAENREAAYYSKLTGKPPVLSNWKSQVEKTKYIV